MKSRITREILNEYALIRLKNQEEFEQRWKNATQLCPRLGDLRRERINLFINQGRVILTQPEKAVEILTISRERAAAIGQEIAACLKVCGFNDDYLNEIFTCPSCRDTGYIGDTIKRECPCLTQKVINAMYKQSNIASFDEQNFDTFDLTIFSTEKQPNEKLSPREYMAYMLEVGKKYATEFPNNQKSNLVLMGESGLGKTFLLNCIAAAVLNRGFTVLKVTAYRMLETMRAYHMGRKDQSDEMDLLLECDLLLIDDLGSEPMLENITIVYLFTLLNERSVKGMHTIIATNLMAGELGTRYTERVLSRMVDTSKTNVFRFIGNDVRYRRGK